MNDCPECSECERLVQDYVDRVLTDADRARVQAHLDSCPRCARCYKLEETLWKHVKRCCEEPMTDDLKHRLLALRTPLQ